MSYHTLIDSQASVYSPAGRFDAHGIGAAQEWLQAQYQAGVQFIIVDLQEVHFIDSAALATLVSGLKSCRSAGGDLVLCSLQQPVAIIFELTKLDRVFEIYPDVTDAANAASRHVSAWAQS